MLRSLAVLLAAAALVAGCAPSSHAEPVRREERIAVDGAKLYVLTRGDEAGAPVLLWLHGGPGGAERPLFRMFNGDLEHSFVVAYWDQRGTGRSFDPDADPAKLTVARHLADMDVVVDRLRSENHVGKVILVGHSWGSALGLLYAQAHPGKVAAFVGVGQVTNEVARERSQYAFIREEALRRGDRRALGKLSQIGLPPYSAEREIAIQRLVERYGGYFHKAPSPILLMARGVLGGYVRPWEFGRLFKGNTVSLKAMTDELLKLDLPRDVPEVKVPVIFMLGRYDRHVDARLAAAYFARLSAPAKRLMWFERSAHNIPFEEPDAFNAALPKLLAAVGAISPQSVPQGAGAAR
jgi:pimeloyl-ACP methyl ester carboxylesterase